MRKLSVFDYISMLRSGLYTPMDIFKDYSVVWSKNGAPNFVYKYLQYPFAESAGISNERRPTLNALTSTYIRREDWDDILNEIRSFPVYGKNFQTMCSFNTKALLCRAFRYGDDYDACTMSYESYLLIDNNIVGLQRCLDTNSDGYAQNYNAKTETLHRECDICNSQTEHKTRDYINLVQGLTRGDPECEHCEKTSRSKVRISPTGFIFIVNMFDSRTEITQGGKHV